MGQRQTAKDWVYPPDLEREVTNQSLGNLVTLMKVADKAAKEKRNLTMTGDFKRSFQCNATSSNSHPFLFLVLVSFLIAEMDVIMKSISVSKEAYATEETRAAKAAKADADLAAQRARTPPRISAVGPRGELGVIGVGTWKSATLREQREHHIVEFLGIPGGPVHRRAPDIAVR